MSALSQQEMIKARKSALESIIISNEMKQIAIDERLRALSSVVKKLISKKGAKIEIFVMEGEN
jgi:hypothetical protein